MALARDQWRLGIVPGEAGPGVPGASHYLIWPVGGKVKWTKLKHADLHGAGGRTLNLFESLQGVQGNKQAPRDPIAERAQFLGPTGCN